MDSLGEFFHRVVDMLPWRQESDKMTAHEAVEDVVIPAFGRNSQPAGVVEQDTPSPERNTGGPENFPFAGGTPDQHQKTSVGGTSDPQKTGE